MGRSLRTAGFGGNGAFPFKHAWTFYNSLESDPTDTTLNLYARPELHKDEVVGMDTVQKIMDGDMAIKDLS